MKNTTGLRPLIEVLNRLRIPYLVGGSVAVMAHGIVRSTQDVDFLANLLPVHIKPFVESLQPDFYVDETVIRECVPVRQSFNILYKPAFYKFDFFLAAEEFHFQQLDRAETVTFELAGEEVTCRVATAEDILIAKLRWYRMSGETSDRQWYDITGLIRVTKNPDHTYLNAWARKLGVSDLLERAIADPDAPY